MATQEMTVIDRVKKTLAFFDARDHAMVGFSGCVMNHVTADYLRDLLAEIEARDRELSHMRMEMLYLRHREYSDNAAECYDNRRTLARSVAKAFQCTKEEQEAFRAAATEHGGTGGELIVWYVNRLRAQLEDAKGATR